MNTICSTPLIKIVIPIYYKKELYLIIDKCLKSLQKHYPEIERILIDDCSPDCSPWRMTLQNEKNLGYTKTVNRGLEFAFKTADTVIVANDDLEFRKGDLDKFRIIDDGIYYPSDSASGDSKCFGAIWGMNKRTYQRLGKLNENYKHFFSDRDYYQKAIKAGLPVVNWPEIIIKHHESATYNLINKKELLQEDEKTFKRNVI